MSAEELCRICLKDTSQAKIGYKGGFIFVDGGEIKGCMKQDYSEGYEDKVLTIEGEILSSNLSKDLRFLMLENSDKEITDIINFDELHNFQKKAHSESLLFKPLVCLVKIHDKYFPLDSFVKMADLGRYYGLSIFFDKVFRLFYFKAKYKEAILSLEAKLYGSTTIALIESGDDRFLVYEIKEKETS